MSITHASGVRDAIANAVKAAFEVGNSQEAQIVLRHGTTTIVTFDLASTPFGAASSGVITAGSMPRAATAVASGDLDNFIAKDQGGTQVLSGSVTAVGMGGDIEVTNVSVATGQDCSLESLTYAAPT
jgi:hypothetical protein